MIKRLSSLLLLFLLGTTAVSFGQDFLRISSDTLTDYFDAESDYDLVADRLGCLEQTVPLHFNEKVYAFVRYFVEKDRNYTRTSLKRSTYYFPIFEESLKKYNLPEELKYLSIIESGLNPRAVSRVGAVGLWQFMPYTGRMHQLHQDWYIDERMDPYESSDAASRYLLQLYNMFEDWELAIAAYNSGPGNVRKAIRRSGYKKTFWEIYRYLPRETRSYLPQFTAIIYAMNYPSEHNLVINDFEYAISYDTIQVKQFTNLRTLATLLELCEEDLERLNPNIKHMALPDLTSPYPVKIPIHKIEHLKTNRNTILDSANKVGKKEMEYLARNSPGSTYGREKIIYRVRSGDVLGKIAMMYGVRVRDIRKWNNLNSNMIRIGQRLDIWLYPGAKVKTIAKNDPVVENLEGKKIYIVQPGDTLWDISKKFKGLTIERIKTLNKLKTNKIKPGQKLIVG